MTFKKVYLVYVLLLVVVAVFAISHVKGLLQKYEEMRPEQCVKAAIAQLAEDAASGNFFTKYELPEVTPGKYEEGMDIKKEYLASFVKEEMTYSSSTGNNEEDELCFDIKNQGRTLATVRLKATGPAVTELGVFSYREWEIQEITPILEKVDYKILVPSDFKITANDILLTAEDGTAKDDKRITYTVAGVYLVPEFEIKNKDGIDVDYTVDGDKVLAKFYDYALLLPSALEVYVNGELVSGVVKEDHRISYTIQTLEKPEVVIKDYYGNSFTYEGKGEIPLTFCSIYADSGYSVKVDDAEIAKEAVTQSTVKEYEPMNGYVDNLPQITLFQVAILKDDAAVSIFDAKGAAVEFEPGEEEYDFTTSAATGGDVPSEVSDEINVLKVAQDWSLFMSNDKKFSSLKQYLIKGSYQYDTAYKYATGVDITFVSGHYLSDPAFTGNSVKNFKWITEDAFSVDVRCVKHMVLKRTGMKVDDEMNNRMYFVKYDDTDDGKDNPTWKLISMREIISDASER